MVTFLPLTDDKMTRARAGALSETAINCLQRLLDIRNNSFMENCFCFYDDFKDQVAYLTFFTALPPTKYFKANYSSTQSRSLSLQPFRTCQIKKYSNNRNFLLPEIQINDFFLYPA